MAIAHPIRATAAPITLKIRIVGVKRLRARIWLGSKIMALAAWIIGCDIEIEDLPEG